MPQWPSDFQPAIGARPRLLRHGLAGHRAFSRESLAHLVAGLPPRQIEHHVADLPLVFPEGRARALPLEPGEVVRGIAVNGCWMIVWHAHAFPPYGELASAVVLPFISALHASERGPRTVEASILVASPRAVVPAHLDKEHSVLVQLEGTKQVSVGARIPLSAYHRQVERRFASFSLNPDTLPDNAETFTLCPGDALYIPAFAVHWVVGGDAPSVSFSCAVSTGATARRVSVYECNARLRRLGLHPRPPGTDRATDASKAALLTTWRRARRRLLPPPGAGTATGILEQHGRQAPDLPLPREN